MTTNHDALREALEVANTLEDEFVEGRISNHTARKAANLLRVLAASKPADDIHSCSSFCTRPECVEALAKKDAALEVALEALETTVIFLNEVRAWAQDVPPTREIEPDKPMHWRAREKQDTVLAAIGKIKEARG